MENTANLAAGLYLVATPIGNLSDITLRAIEVLKACAMVACEDTRVSAVLLAHYGISKPLLSVREHNEARAAQRIVAAVAEGAAVAYVSDAGTPAISDPGARLTAAVRAAGLAVIPVPGPSAVAAALSAGGQALDHWLFYGFLPARPGERRQALQTLRALPYALVFYESPHRIVEAIDDLADILDQDRMLTVARELTKRFEAVHTLPLGEAPAWLRADANRQRGEFVLILGVPAKPAEDAETLRGTLTVLLDYLPVSQAAQAAARLTGAKKNAAYRLALEMRTAK